MKKLIFIISLLFSFMTVSNLAYGGWLVKGTSGSVTFTLNDNGTITKTLRGDPKSGYDQKENCNHGKSKNCITNFLENATVLAQGGARHEDYFITYRLDNDIYVVHYDLKDYGEPTSCLKNGEEISIDGLELESYYDVDLPDDLKRVVTWTYDGVLLGMEA